MTALVGTITQEGRWQAGMQYEALGSYTLGGAIVTADTITWSNILPANDVQVMDFEFYGAELDTNGSPTGTLIVGDGTTTNGYLTSKVCGSANQQFFVKGDGAFIGASTQSGRNIVATVGGTLATAASSGTVYVRVRYYCNAA